MTVEECKELVQGYFQTKRGFEHFDDKTLKVGSKNYRIKPDDLFAKNSKLFLVEYENTKMPVESISKHWWLLESTDWFSNGIKSKNWKSME